tara:strand:+ start:2235 stop:4112 length:1878 start_codon:yes stop_codon:yes gene_type:complete
MAYTRPGVFIEEILTPEQSEAGVSTSVGSFLGITQRGPADKAILVSSLNDFERIFGGPIDGEPLYYSVRSFFENGGASAYIVRLYSDAASPVAANTVLGNALSTPADLLKFKAGYRGLDSFGAAGKDLSVKVRLSTNFVSQYDAANNIDDLTANANSGDTLLKVRSIQGIQEGAILKITEAVSGVQSVSYAVVSETRSTVVNGAVEHSIILTTGSTATLTAADSKIEVLEYDIEVLDKSLNVLETWSAVSMNPDADNYIETIINDTEIGSIYVVAEDNIPGGNLTGAKEIANAHIIATHIPLSSDGGSETVGLVSTDVIGTEANARGIYALSEKDSVNILCIPPSTVISSSLLPAIQVAMLDYCGDRMDMFAVLDTPSGLTAQASGSGSVGEYRKNTLGVDSFWGALYYPHVVVKSKDGSSNITLPPSGVVAGLYSRVDSIPAPQGSVASSPAGFGDFGVLRGLVKLESNPTEKQHGNLNPIGINCLRRLNRADGLLPGIAVLGARTLSSKVDFTYINVRRLMTFIEQNIKFLARPSLFRNNGPQLWEELTSEFEGFLSKLFRNGQLAGESQEQAFYVKIDASLNTPDQIQRGLLIGEIGVATLKPAEFMVFRFSQTSAGTTIEE